MRLAALRCQNDRCPEFRLGDCEVNPADPNIESEWESLEHDARLSGWVRFGSAHYCSEECRDSTVDDAETRLLQADDIVLLPDEYWEKQRLIEDARCRRRA